MLCDLLWRPITDVAEKACRLTSASEKEIHFLRVGTSRRFRLTLSLLMVALATGCSWTDARGTHRLIVGIGFGLITTTSRSGVEVEDYGLLGAAADPDGGRLGWMRHHRVRIDPMLASNVVISIRSMPGNLTITNYAPFWCVNPIPYLPRERNCTP